MKDTEINIIPNMSKIPEQSFETLKQSQMIEKFTFD